MDGLSISPSRGLRATVSFLAVVAGYWAYALLAVPWIEPPARERTSHPTRTQSVRNTVRLRHAELLETLFQPDAWQRQRPKVIETDRAVLLLQDYRTLDNGRLELKPCTCLFLPEGKKAGGSPHQVIVLDAPEGAELQFDESLDLQRGEIGQLVGGRLVGEVTIRGNESRPGAGDQLYLSTRNVQMDDRRIWTPHEVEFRYGGNHGRGRDLIITLLADGAADDSQLPGIGGLKSIEVVHLERLHLESNADFFSGNDDSDSAASDTASAGESPKLGQMAAPPMDGPSHIEITCQGPFLFDFEEGLATFEEQVDVLRLHLDGPSDQLKCRLLEIHFGDDEADRAASKKSTAARSDRNGKPTFDTEVSKIVALGHPVVLQSPSLDAQARGERLEFDLLRQRFTLDGQRTVVLNHGQRRIEARSVRYEMPSQGRLGQAWAEGPGRFFATLEGEQPRTVTARWRKQLRLRPAGPHHVLSLHGKAQVGASEIGQLSAREIHLWLIENGQDNDGNRQSPTHANAREETGAMDGSPAILPDRLLAKGDVALNSVSLTGSTERFEVWFHHVSEHEIKPPAANRSRDEHSPPPIGPPRRQQTTGMGQYNVSGKLLRVLVAVDGKQMQLRDVSITGDARLVETQTREADAVPLRVTGEAVHVTGADSTQSKAVVIGKPAVVSGRGLTLRSGSVHFDRAANRAWVPAAGEMTLPLKGALLEEGPKNAPDDKLSRRPNSGGNSRAEDAPPTATITWQSGMQFDGRTIRVRGDVVTRTELQQIRAPALDVSLTRRVDFSNPPRRHLVDLQRISFLGQVWLENRSIDPNLEGSPTTSIDQMQVRDLSIDHQTGELTAQGPGWIKTVRRGGNMAARPPFSGTRAGPSDGEEDEGDRLTYLRVTFQQGMTGNVHQRHVELHEEVHAVYGRVDDWNDMINPDLVSALDEDIVLLDTDMLQVAESGQRTNDRSPIELKALGNVLVEGKTYTARAHRVSYTQAKDLLVVEGDGRSDAQLFRQRALGAEAARATARKIFYWPGSGRMHVDTFNSIDWAGPLGPPGGGGMLSPRAGEYLRQENERRAPLPSTPPR